MQLRSTSAIALSTVLAAAGIATFSAGTGCQQQPIEVPVRTFERAQKMDVVCLKVVEPNAEAASGVVAITPVPAPTTACAPVPSGTNGSLLPYHLFALVTQTARGELAAVDLTAGRVIDEDVATPGINFIPVGALPTDVAVTPDGKMAFVTSAEVNKPALYGVPTHLVLGNSQGLSVTETPPAPRVTAWPVCALPQAPSAVTVVPRRSLPAGGVTPDGGAPPAEGDVPYDVVVVMPGAGDQPAQVVTIDPRAFLRSGGIDAGADEASGTYPPGQLVPCRGTIVALKADVPTEFSPGPPWDDGVKYVDGGVDLRDASPAQPASCTATTGDAGTTDGGGGLMLTAVKGARPHAAATVRDDQTLYVADDALPIIHVLDLSTPNQMRELPPLVATSVSEPERNVTIGAIAVSPPTREYKRYLYAVDRGAGSLMVFDVTTPPTAPRVALTRPHPELNPFQPVDRIVFGAPVANVAFVSHDWPLRREVAVSGENPIDRPSALTGLLCNPNPSVGTSYLDPYTDPGANYRANSRTAPAPLGPGRLRGVFAFATLSNGQVVTIDIDDWDAPCRRPDPMTSERPVSATAPGQPNGGPTDTDPYHAPRVYTGDLTTPVSLEAFYPVSAPHRARSVSLLRRDPSLGVHIPHLVGLPQLIAENRLIATSGPEGELNPLMLPTSTPYEDPTYVLNPTESDPANRAYSVQPDDEKIALPARDIAPNVRFSWEDPLVHFDQDWLVTYEGSIPGFEGVRTIVTTRDEYRTLDLTSPDGLFCRRGVEDYKQGKARVEAAAAAAAKDGIVLPPQSDRRTVDYVQITSEVRPVGDPYWQQNLDADAGAGSCWPDVPDPDARQRICGKLYGLAADESLERDFPILEAYEGKLVIGRYGRPAGATVMSTASREVVEADDSNRAFLKSMRCCFGAQVSFKVRAGGEWVAVSSALGFLHHVRASATPERACTQSCAPHEALLNARTLEVPRPAAPLARAPDRNSPLAMRNPMFSFVMWSGGAPSGVDKTTSRRDYIWKLSTRGQFLPLSVNLARQTTSVSPQSMRFIDTLGRLAVVDGASQGLSLIDLNTVTVGTPYF